MATAAELAILIRAKDDASDVIAKVGHNTSAAMKLVGVAAASGGVAIAAGLAVGVKGAMDLQQSVANISTIAPSIDTSKVFASLNEMSTRVPQTAAQLGDSLYNIFSSIDVSQADALKLLEQFSKGAVGAGTSAETFGTAAMGVMNAYGLSVDQASHVSDVFFNTVKRGVVTGQELASSLGPVTQSAKAAGVSLDELGGFIAGVTKEGGPAAQNINNLNNFLSKVNTHDAQAALNQMGVVTVDATGKFRPMTEVLTDLKAKLSGMTEAAKLNAIQTIFPDAQARQGAMTLISQLDNVKSAIDENKTHVGAAADAYKTMSETASSQMALAKNSVIASLTTIGAQFLPLMTPLIKGFAEDVPKAFHAGGDGVAWVVKNFEALKPLLTSLSGVLIAAVLPALTAWTLATARQTAALVAQAAATSAAYAPIIALGAAIAILGRGVYDLATGFDVGTTKGEQFRAGIEKFGATAGKGYVDTFVQMAGAHKTAAETAQFFVTEQERLASTGTALTTLYVNQHAALQNLMKAHDGNSEAVRIAAQRDTELQTATLENTAQQRVLADALKSVTGMTADQAQKMVANAAATQDAAVKTAELATQQVAATVAAIPFGTQLVEIQKKAKDAGEAFDLAGKFIDELAGKMTGTEQILTRSAHSLDAVGSSAQAAFSSKSSDSISFWADQAKKAADSAALGEEPTRKLDTLIDQIAKHGPGSAAALETLKKVIADSKAPIDDANKAYADQRQVTADLAHEQLGLGGSLDALRKSLEQFVQVFLLQMGQIPPNAESISTQTLQAFSIGGAMNSKGQDAIQGFITGMLIKRAMAEETARIIALGAVVATSGALRAESPSKAMMEIGEWAGEGLAIGMLNRIGRVAAAAKHLIDDGFAPFVDVLEVAAPGVSTLAATIAGSVSAIDEYRSGLYGAREQLQDVNDRLLGLHRTLLNTAPHSAARTAIEEQIKALQQDKSEIDATIRSYTELTATATKGISALDGWSDAVGRASHDLANVAQFGTLGVAAIDAFNTALLQDTPAAGAAAVKAITAAAEAARKAGVPNWRELGDAQIAAYGRALSERTPEAIQAALNSTQAINDAIVARQPTLLSAVAEALDTSAINDQVGSNWGGTLIAAAAAIDTGKDLPIQALGRFRADAIIELSKLPRDIQDRLTPEATAAWQAFVDNPSAESLAAVRANAALIHEATAIIPKGFATLTPEVQGYILSLVDQVGAGALGIEEATTRAGQAANLIPKGFAGMLPEVRGYITSLVNGVAAGALDIETATQRAADAAKLIPAGFADLPPQIQGIIRDIAGRVESGSIDITKATGMIADAAKLIPSGFRRMAPEVQAAINTIVGQVQSGSLDIDSALERISDAQKLIPADLRKMTPDVQNEIRNIVAAWQSGAIDITAATDQIAVAVKKAADATAAAAASMQAAIAAIGSVGGSSHTTGSSISGQAGVDVKDGGMNLYGIPGLTSSTVTEPGQQPTTTYTYGGKSFAVPGSGSLADVMAHLGFTNESAFKAWIEAQKAAFAKGGFNAPSGAGLGLYGTNLGDVDGLLAALGYPAQGHADGGIFAEPTMMWDVTGRRHLFGEAGPEALVPLTNRGGGAGNMTPDVTVHITVQGDINDADRFAQKVQAAMQTAMQRRY